MKAKTFSMTFPCKKNPSQQLDEDLNAWLAEPEQDGLVVKYAVPFSTEVFTLLTIFYVDQTAPVDLRRRPDETMCGQCKKNPAIEGLKICGACREYQKDYREKRKEEKKGHRYP